MEGLGNLSDDPDYFPPAGWRRGVVGVGAMDWLQRWSCTSGPRVPRRVLLGNWLGPRVRLIRRLAGAPAVAGGAVAVGRVSRGSLVCGRRDVGQPDRGRLRGPLDIGSLVSGRSDVGHRSGRRGRRPGI